MTARILTFHRTADSAWDAYQRLNAEALADTRLLFDRAHQQRREQAHETFARLFRRECRQRVEGGRL